jgi:hypothetical protein
MPRGTKKDVFNYYESELSKLVQSEYPMSVKFFDGNGNQTKQLDLNAESIREIQKLFKKLSRKAA